MIIEDLVVDRKVSNLNVNSLSESRWKNIVELANKWQVGNASIPLL